MPKLNFTDDNAVNPGSYMGALNGDRASGTGGLLGALVQNTTVAVFAKALDGRYVLANAMCEQLWKVPAPQIVGRTDAEMLPGDDARHLIANDERAFREGRGLEAESMLENDVTREALRKKW